ncbi:MAG: ATP-binding protein [Gemmatimonadota bacterium]
MNHTQDHATAGTTARSDFLDRLSRLPVMGAFLRVPLFWKIVLANVFIVAAGVAAGTWVAARVEPGGDALALVGLATGSGIALATLVLDAVLVRLALSPLRALKETAGRVRAGDLDARVPSSPVTDRDLGALMDVFNQMLDSLSQTRRMQRELARRVLESEERERERIAHELFSGTAQTLAGVLVRLRVAERHLNAASGEALEEIRSEVVNALEEVRSVARRLRPPELDELGLRAALEAHARSLAAGKRLEVRFSGEIPPLPRASTLAVFRIVQEAITNAVLHAAADLIQVRFATEGNFMVAEIEDDGVGFDLGSALAHTGENLGLFGMHERAGYVQGELSLESGPGRGTRVRLLVPLTSDVELSLETLPGMVDRLMEGLVEADLVSAVQG